MLVSALFQLPWFSGKDVVEGDAGEEALVVADHFNEPSTHDQSVVACATLQQRLAEVSHGDRRLNLECTGGPVVFK